MIPSLVFYDELRFFVNTLPFFLGCVKGCNGNNEFSFNQNAFTFDDNIFSI